MHYPQAYIEYLAYFHGPRDWFECHEIMEAYWKQECSVSLKRQWLVLVQIAVSLYHERRGNLEGAFKLLSNVLTYAEDVDWNLLGIDGTVLKKELKLRKLILAKRVMNKQKGDGIGVKFMEWNFPILDAELVALCTAYCVDKGWMWCMTGSRERKEVTDKHLLRDRTGVIKVRQKAHALRKLGKGTSDRETNQ